MEENQLENILKLHQKWMNNEPGGERANLRDANLQGVSLWRPNLRGADLQRANLWGANLRGANLRDANLQEANLQEANLQDTDLRGANLRGADPLGADLRGADLKGANLRGANLDYVCWPLWCGSFDVRVCKRIAVQLAYHFCRLDCDDPEVIAAQNALIPLANQFHRVGQCGKLEPKEEK